MTEDEARAWLLATFGPSAMRRLERFSIMLRAEAERQSLIARSTFDTIWSRHLVDSAQLVALADPDGLWLDVGSGGGLPGIVIAIVRESPLVIIEPRKMRADFLRNSASELQLGNVEVVQGKAQAFDRIAAVISARAVAQLSDIFAWTTSNVSRGTKYLLPRGENASSDLAMARHAWQGTFHVEQSITDPVAGIVVATQVRPR